MKRIVLSLALITYSGLILAQTKFGLKAGSNFASALLKEDGSSTTYSPSSRLSFNFTGLADIPLSPVISFQPGISVSGKGYETKETIDVVDFEYEYKQAADLLYLEIPLNAVAKFNAGNGKLLVGAGPYAGYGLSGKAKITIKGTDENGKAVSESEKVDIEFGDEEDKLKSLDFGVNFLTGYELNNGLSFNVGYGLGLSNISPKDSGSTMKHKIFSISLGFLF